MQVNRLVRVQFCEALLDLAEWHERRAVDLCDLELVLLADVDHGDAKVGVIECTFHFLDVDFVRVFLRLSRLIRNAAKLVVIDQFADGRVVTANRTLGIAAQFDLAKLHLQRVENQQSPDER